MVKSQILADFDSWNDEGIQASFNSGINDCASWGGSFDASRKKRSIEEVDTYVCRILNKGIIHFGFRKAWKTAS